MTRSEARMLMDKLYTDWATGLKSSGMMIVWKFRDGASIFHLAIKFKTSKEEIEQLIRAYMSL